MDEQIIVLKNSKFLKMPRREAHETNSTCIAVIIMIFDFDNNIWIHQRGPKAGSPFIWDFSSGGHANSVDFNKEAERELKEETGIKAKPIPCNKQIKMTFESDGKNLTHNHIFYYIKTDSIPIADGKEVADFRKISLKNLIKDIDINSDKYMDTFKEFVKTELEDMMKKI